MKRWGLLFVIILFVGQGIAVEAWAAADRAVAQGNQAGSAPPAVREGVLDLSGWDLSTDGPVPLEGEWAFYWNRLLEPGNFGDGASGMEGSRTTNGFDGAGHSSDQGGLRGSGVRGGSGSPFRSNGSGSSAASGLSTAVPSPTGYFPVPSFWSKYEPEGKALPRNGYATYRLVIIGNRSEESLGIKMMYAYSGVRIWANGKLVWSNGEPGRTRQQEIPRFMASTVTELGSAGERIELVIQLSNFHNPQGGLISGFVIGTADRLHAMKLREVIEDSLVFGALMIMSAYHSILYALRRKDRTPLYFSLFCLCIAVRTLLSNSKFVLDLFPGFPWEWFAKLSYLTVYVGLFFLASFVYHLFPAQASKRVRRCMQWFCGALAGLVLLTDIRIYDLTLPAFELVALLFLLYTIYAVIRAARQRQDGAYLFLAGFVVLLLAAVNDMLSRLTLVPTPALMQYAMLVFVFLQSVILSARFSRSFAQVERLSERLLSLDKLKDEFLAKTSHELRTPLVGIIGLTETLMDGSQGEPSPQTARLLRLIRDSGKRLAHLVDDILDFSKLKNNDLQIRPVVVDAARLTELVLLLLRPLAAKKGLTLDNRVPAGLFVHADENRLQQILHNLVGNAIKFTEEGSITVSAEPAGSFVSIRVADTGIGIPERELARIFESFEQLETALEHHVGTGIGLAIAKQLVELQQGRIGVTSKVGEGSVFFFTLPAAAAGERREVAEDAGLVAEATEQAAEFEAMPEPQLPDGRIDVLKSAGTPPAGTYAAASGRVWAEIAAAEQRSETSGSPVLLIVDDDPINVEVLVNYVRGSYRAVETCSAREAIRWIREGLKPDLVLLDIMMPHANGFDICRHIRARYGTGEVPVLFLSARNQIADLTTAFELGASDYIVKPVDKQELLARIAMHLRLSQWNRSLEEELSLRTGRLESVMRETAKAMAEMSVLEERNRIARDIHDQVGHTLTASIVQMEAAMLMASKDPQTAVGKLQPVSELVRQGLKEMRQSVHMLHEQTVELSLFSSLIKLVQDTEKYAGVVVEHAIEPIARPLPAGQEKLIYRALQEGITNGIRHGRSRRFRFELKQAGSNVLFTLENDGLPYTPGAFGLGLAAMKEQAERWQGTFRIEAVSSAESSGGCRLSITLPIPRS